MKKIILFTIVAAWLLIPTGTPDDIITWFLIAKLGPVLYGFTLLIIISLILYYGITFEKVTKTIKRVLKWK